MWTIVWVILGNSGGFFLFGGLLHYAYHRRGQAGASAWKHQPNRWQDHKAFAEKLPLVLVNSTIISTCIGLALHLGKQGTAPSKMYWSLDGHSLLTLALGTAVLPFWYHFMLFYVHFAMHRFRWMYKTFHHLHHKYKSPIWLDALYEHPVEALWGGIVLSAPTYLWPIHGYAYLAFVGVVGLHEVLDHAGIKLNVPLLSPSLAHDDHHLRFRCYYGQLLSLLDRLHKTDRIPKTRAEAMQPGE